MSSFESSLPRISVIVPSFNQGRFLAQNLESIFRQKYPALEVIVMDGGSTDESVEIIQRHASRLTYWRSAPDSGQSAAINEGMQHATGELVAWLNSDDFYWQDSLWTVARAYAAHPGHGLYLGNGLRFNEHDQSYAPFNRRHMAFNRTALEQGLDYLLQPAVFFARDAWQQVQGLDPELHYCMDWDILIRIARRRSAVLINEFLAVSREYSQTKTSTGRIRRVREIESMIQRHTGREVTSGSLYYFFEALLESLEGADQGAVRPHVFGGMKAIRRAWRDCFGSADGFPELSDPQDHIYMPLATGNSTVPPIGDGHELPSITVVVPSFNQAQYLGQTLQSLFGQQYPRLEVLVMDGGSTDGSVDVIRQYADRLAGWVSEPDQGPAHAINKGLARAQGELVTWLASDDMLAEGALRAAARCFAADPQLDLVYGNALYVDGKNELFLAKRPESRTGLYYGEMRPPEQIPAYWTYIHEVPQPAVLFRRRLIEQCGALDESYQFIFDFELFYRFAKRARIRKLERTQAFYRIHPEAKTSHWDHFLVELYRFSRQHWPQRRSPGFRPQLAQFVNDYMERRHGGVRTWKHRLVRLGVALAVWTGWGNPEAFARWRNRRNERTNAATEIAAPVVTQTNKIEIDAASPRRYRSFFCSKTWPKHPGYSGGEIRDFHLLRHLLTLSRITCYSLFDVPNDGRPDVLAPLMQGVHTAGAIVDAHGLRGAGIGERTSWPRRLIRGLQRRGWPVLGPHYHADGASTLPGRQLLWGAFQDDLDSSAPDFLFVSPQDNGMVLPPTRIPARTRVILASYDVEAVRIARLGDARSTILGRLAGRWEAERARRFERDLVARLDGVIAVSDLDKRLFVELYGIDPERVLVVNNGIDPDYFAFQPRPAGNEKVVVFTASLGYSPNHQAALRLVDRIMPLVRRQYPEARLCIVGQNPSRELLARHDGVAVNVTGKVPDVRPYLAAASVSCVPLMAGSGTKYKVLEALSAGVPVVCTPLGSEGLELTPGEHLLVEQTDAELAAAIGSVLADPKLAAQLAVQGRNQVERLYSWNANLARLGPWLDELARLPRRISQPGDGGRTAAHAA